MKATTRIVIATFAVLSAAGAGHWLGARQRPETQEENVASLSESTAEVRPLGRSRDRLQRAPEASRLALAQKRLPNLTIQFLGQDDWQTRSEISHLLKDLNAVELDTLARDFDPADLETNGDTVLSMIFSQLVRTDPEMARLFILDLAKEVATPPLYESSVLKSQLLTYAREDPRGALELADSWSDQSEDVRELLSDVALEHLAEIDLGVFRSRFAAMDNDRRARILRGLTLDADSERSTLAEAVRLADSLPPEQAEEIRTIAVETIGKQDIEQGLALLQEWDFSDEPRQDLDVGMTISMLQEASDEESRTILEGYLQRNPDKQQWNRLESPLQSWCERSPAGYVAWLDSLPDGPGRDAAASAAAGSRIWLPQAEAFAEVIGNDYVKLQAKDKLERRRKTEEAKK
ncbi:MAG: hypothetical protein QM755_04840 [Luteolibacter sp.]